MYDAHIALEISLSKYIIVFLGKRSSTHDVPFRCKKKKKQEDAGC
jgi:hypothetical protein